MEGLKNLFVVNEYEQLVVAGITGAMQKPLSGAREILQVHQSFENSPVIRESGRYFLASICVDPPMDITVCQYNPSESSFLGYALDKAKLMATLEELIQSVGFIPYLEQDKRVVAQWAQEFQIEKRTYDMCVQVANQLKQPLEKIFGMVRYSNFLHRYKNVDDQNAMNMAAEKFGVTL